MRLRNNPKAKPYLHAHLLVADDALAFSKALVRASSTFRQVHVEIGIGKGRFIQQKCLSHPDIFFAGIERYSSVLYKAVQKFDESVHKNVIFACADAETLSENITGSPIDVIYINFPDPWPKARHAHRRLLGLQNLARFSRILKIGGRLYFKTDNRELFEFALKCIQLSDFKLDDLTYDLHNINGFFADNIITEYEQRFMEQRQPIHALALTRVEPYPSIPN